MTDHGNFCALLVSIDEAFVERMTRNLYPHYRVTHCRPQHDDIIQAIKSYEPDVCFIDVDDLKWEDSHHLDLIEDANIITSAPIIVVCYELSTSLVVECIRAGARDVCEKDSAQDEVLTIVEGLFRRRRGRRGDHAAEFIVVLGTQAGVGATTTALAIAQDAARRVDSSERILLIDLSLPPPEIPDLVAIEPRYYMNDAIQDTGRLDETFIENAFSKTSAMPLYILPLCRTLEEAHSLNDSDITILLSVLKTYFHTIILDANWTWNPGLTARFMLDADKPVVCCSQSVTAIHAGVAILDDIRDRVSDGFEFDLVVTRYSDAIYPWLDDVGETLGNMTRIHTIPEDRPFVDMSRNMATPLARSRRTTKFEQSINSLVSNLLPELPQQGLSMWWQSERLVRLDPRRFLRRLITNWRKLRVARRRIGAALPSKTGPRSR